MDITDYRRFRYKDFIYLIRKDIINYKEMKSIIQSPIRIHELTMLSDLIFNQITFDVIKNRFNPGNKIPNELFPTLFTGVDIEIII